MWVCVSSSTQFLCPPNSRRWHPGVKGEMGGDEAVTIINNSRVWVRLTVKTWIDHPSQDTSDCHQSPPSVTSPLVNIKTRGGRRARLTFLLLTINLSTKPAPGGPGSRADPPYLSFISDSPAKWKTPPERFTAGWGGPGYFILICKS